MTVAVDAAAFLVAVCFASIIHGVPEDLLPGSTIGDDNYNQVLWDPVIALHT